MTELPDTPPLLKPARGQRPSPPPLICVDGVKSVAALASKRAPFLPVEDELQVPRGTLHNGYLKSLMIASPNGCTFVAGFKSRRVLTERYNLSNPL